MSTAFKTFLEVHKLVIALTVTKKLLNQQSGILLKTNIEQWLKRRDFCHLWLLSSFQREKKRVYEVRLSLFERYEFLKSRVTLDNNKNYGEHHQQSTRCLVLVSGQILPKPSNRAYTVFTCTQKTKESNPTLAWVRCVTTLWKCWIQRCVC